ncbi:MAG: dTDP-glucose 4,6-dehydratase [Rhodomicrobium sp.]
MKTYLVTGGAGFIGSNFICHLINSDPACRVINLDKITYAANLDNLREVRDNSRYHFVKGDICNRELVEYLFKAFDIRGVFHLAAESHVDNSIAGPQVFIETNIQGTFNVLDVARRAWMTGPGEARNGYEDCRFLYVSTDEVYGSLEDSGLFTEATPFSPSSPYSASKAAADMLVRSYHKTYGMNVVVTNCSNNYGPKQHPENFIPLIIERALTGRPIPIFGDGRYIRDWLYVGDHCKAIKLVFDRGRSGESYNVGGRNEKENLWIVETICGLLEESKPSRTGTYAGLVTLVRDRPGHDRRYAIDAAKLENELGWRAEENLASGIKKTVSWYLWEWENRGAMPDSAASS